MVYIEGINTCGRVYIQGIVHIIVPGWSIVEQEEETGESGIGDVSCHYSQAAQGLYRDIGGYWGVGATWGHIRGGRSLWSTGL